MGLGDRPSIRQVEGSGPEKLNRALNRYVPDSQGGGRWVPRRAPVQMGGGQFDPNAFRTDRTYRQGFRDYVNAAKSYLQRAASTSGASATGRGLAWQSAAEAIQSGAEPAAGSVVRIDQPIEADPTSRAARTQALRELLRRRNTARYEMFGPTDGLLRDVSEVQAPPSLLPIQWGDYDL